MKNLKIDGLDDNVTILALGSLFRRSDLSRWGMNVLFSKNQEKSSLSVSQAPILARKRVLNVISDSTPSGWRQSFSIASTREWKTGVIGDCSLRSNSASIESNAYCFVFQSEEGLTVYLPQFELARALFFHNAYLARSAISALPLSADFDVSMDTDGDTAFINILPSSGCPLGLFRESGPRQLISWILLDQDARQSYESIGTYQLLHGWDEDSYRKWNFQFEPLPLEGAHFQVRGVFNAISKTLFVYEIDAIRNLSADIPTEIKIYHPKFKLAVLEGNKTSSPPIPTRPNEHNNHDGEGANESTERVIIKIPSIELQFNKAFRANKVSEKEVKPRGGGPNEDSTNEASTDVSTEEPTAEPGLPGAEFDGADDATQNDHLYESKFTYFLTTIGLLAGNYGWTIENKRTIKLPKIPGFSKHLLKSDQSPRCLAVISIKSKKRSFIILELDMSDTRKPLSTLILSVQHMNAWPENLDTIMTEIVKAPLRWPFEKLSYVCGGVKNYKGVPHPRSSDDNIYALDDQALDHWAHRLDIAIARLLNK
jgi:hypothetical protein